MLRDDLKKYVESNCANYDRDGKCLLETGANGCRECPFFLDRESLSKCTYFSHMVLPGDDKLNARYWQSFGLLNWNAKLAVCKRCENPYERKHNRVQFCDPCREQVRREKRRERNRRYRRKKQA